MNWRLSALPLCLLAACPDSNSVELSDASTGADSNDTGDADPATDATDAVDASATDADPVEVDGVDVSPDSDGDADADVEPGFEPVRWIHDGDGAVLLLHGINLESAAKSDPEGLARFDATDVERVANGWGFNFVRYLIFWEHVEPVPGEIDQEYLQAVRERLDLFEEAGIHVLIDMHQDVYSREFCCDGAPAWAVRDDGLPFELQSAWFANYFQPAVTRAFDNFWGADGPHGDLQEHFRGAWVGVAAALGDHPAVIGYDLFNEPFPGSLFDLGEALSRTSPANGGRSRRFDEQVLGPFYQRLIDAIRAVDADTYIFYESRYGAPGNGSPSYVPRLDDPRDGEPRLVYSPHLYSVTLEANNAYGASDRTIVEWERQRLVDIERQGHPTVAGEWGLAYGATDAARFFEEVVEMADRNLMGWAYWSYDPSGADGWGLWNRETGEDNPAASIVVRPYVRRWPGEPVSMTWDPVDGVLRAVLDVDPDVEGALEAFIPAFATDGDVTVSVPGADAGSWTSERDASSGVLRVTLPRVAARLEVVVDAGVGAVP